MRHIIKLLKRTLPLLVQFLDQKRAHVNLLSEDLRKLALLLIGSATVGFFSQSETIINLTSVEAIILLFVGILLILIGLAIFKPVDDKAGRKEK
ncbi:hypothetical protein [Endozoicomonas sp. ALC066]|uniref:hypothetical protein n=1 Tax=Endozoicomonas sp. ALC066 TaxID=3403078 RepID=UPI003BB71A92